MFEIKTMLEYEKRLYDVKEAAFSLSVSPKTIRRLVKRGLLRPNRAIRRLLFSVVELDKFASS